MSHPPFQASVTEAMKAWTTSPSSLVPASRRRMSSAFLSGAPSRYHAVASFLLVETTRKGLQMTGFSDRHLLLAGLGARALTSTPADAPGKSTNSRVGAGDRSSLLLWRRRNFSELWAFQCFEWSRGC